MGTGQVREGWLPRYRHRGWWVGRWIGKGICRTKNKGKLASQKLDHSLLATGSRYALLVAIPSGASSSSFSMHPSCLTLALLNAQYLAHHPAFPGPKPALLSGSPIQTPEESPCKVSTAQMFHEELSSLPQVEVSRAGILRPSPEQEEG